MRHLARPSGPIVLAAVLACLLLVVASLQWRWLGRISADERERMQTSLRTQVTQFTQEFDRELTRAFFWLQSDRVPGASPAPTNSIAHFERWYSSAPHPGLVRGIYVVSVEHREHAPRSATASNAAPPVLRVSTYDREREVLVPTPSPPVALAPILARLAKLPPASGLPDRGAWRFRRPSTTRGPRW